MNTTEAGEVIRIGDIGIRFHVEAEVTDGRATVFESRIRAGARVPPPHRHLGYEETIACLAGECHFTVEGRERVLRPGDAPLHVQRGQVHSFANRGREEVRLLVVVTPGLLGPEYFREVAGIVNAGGPPDFTRIAAVMARHGMEVADGS